MLDAAKAAAQSEVNEAGAGVLDVGAEIGAETEPSAIVGDDGVAYVVVTAPGPTMWTTEIVTPTTSSDAAPTPLQPVGQGS